MPQKVVSLQSRLGGQSDDGASRLSGWRLSSGLSGTNLERAGDYNLRTVLQAIRLGGETTRVELVQQTGLTAPTIANITGRLVEMGLVANAGRRQGGRGQPALRLALNPDGAFGIGLTIDRDHLTLVAVDLAGQVRGRVTREIAFAMPADVLAFIAAELGGLIAQGKVARDRILGVGVAIPDEISRIALPGRPDDYGVWATLDVTALVAGALPWSVHLDNDAAAAALGEAQCGTMIDHPSFFYLLISVGLGGGPVIDRTYHRGATRRSGEIGLIPDPGSGVAGAKVQDTVSLAALQARLAAAGLATDVDRLAEGDAASGAIVERWLDDAVRALTMPLVAVNCLVNPDAILIGGRLPMPLIRRLADRLTAALAAIALPAQARVMPAMMAQDAPAIGAAILPFLDRVLPSDAILIQAGRG